MSTNFFEQQSLARQSTRWLVVLFALAVVAIVGTTFAVTWMLVQAGNESHEVTRLNRPGESYDAWSIALMASGGALALVLGGSLFKIAQLGGGGTTVAERLGGMRIYPNTTGHLERRVLNVVEEMALASGVPVPPVFMLPDESGINAFAAGYSPSDAVVAVTRGCVEQLTREQLQGVIAHEFSHILNGDMRLNIRMIGVLHGILLLGLLGRILLYSSGRSRGSSRNNGVVAILLVGLAMLLLGFIGTLMGNLIKAAVSRQREYLADASAVQFTRNPSGIAGALKRIGAAMFGSKIRHAGASELSHMYFAQGVWEGFTGLMATHPPLPNRIQRLDPQWDGKFPERFEEPVTDAAGVEAAPTAAGLVGGAVMSGRLTSDRVRVEVVEHATDQIGDPTEIHRLYAAELVDALPAPVRSALREPYGARAVLFALLLDKDSRIRNVQMEALTRNASPDVVALTRQLTTEIDQLDVRTRLPLVDLALPSLRAMARSQYVVFSKCFHQLVQADQRLGLFEWALFQILMRHLHPQFERVRRPFVQYFALKRLGHPCSVLFSALARAGHGGDQAQAAFAVATRHFPEVSIELLPPEECGLKQLDAALRRLVQVSVKQRRRLIDAAAVCICADARVEVREAELLRAISDMLDCPMPPLLPGQPVGNG